MESHASSIALPGSAQAVGRVFLYYPEIPALCCTLLSVDSFGCRARVPLQQLDVDTALTWQYILLPGQHLRLRFDLPGGMIDFDTISSIKVLTSSGPSYELELLFDNLDPARGLQLVRFAYGDNAPQTQAANACLQEFVIKNAPPPPPPPPLPRPHAAPRGAGSSSRRPAVNSVPVNEPVPPPPSAPVTAPEEEFDDGIPMATPAEDVDDALVDTSPPALDATIAVPRPPSSHLEITQEIERTPSKFPDAGDATIVDAKPDAPLTDATVSMAGYRIQPERRASARSSGQMLVAVPDKQDAPSRKLGEILVESGKLTAEQLQEALDLVRSTGQKLGRVLLSAGAVTPDELCRAISQQIGRPMTLLESDTIPERLRNIFPLSLMMHHSFVPFDDSGAQLCIAASNPIDPASVKELEKISRRFIEVFVARDDQVGRQLDWLRVKMKTRSRRYLRFDFRHAVSYQFSNRAGAKLNRDVYPGSTVNISEGGCLIESPQPSGVDPAELLRKGFFINLNIKIDSGTIWAVGEIREIRLGGDDSGPRWLMGVEFVDVSPENRQLLKQICHSAAHIRRVPSQRLYRTPVVVDFPPAEEAAPNEQNDLTPSSD